MTGPTPYDPSEHTPHEPLDAGGHLDGPPPGPDQAPYGYHRPGYDDTPLTGEAARPSGDERTAAILAHVSALIAMLFSAGSLSFLGPLLVWLIYKDKSDYVRQAAAGSFNFNLSMTIIYVLSWVAFFTIIGIPAAIAGWIFSVIGQIVWHLIATSKAADGEHYRYPLQTPVLN